MEEGPLEVPPPLDDPAEDARADEAGPPEEAKARPPLDAVLPVAIPVVADLPAVADAAAPVDEVEGPVSMAPLPPQPLASRQPSAIRRGSYSCWRTSGT